MRKPPAASAHACARISRSTAAIRSGSASRRNDPAPSSPWRGWRQRASASIATSPPPSSATIGWKCATSSPNSSAAASSSRPVAAPSFAGCISGNHTRTWLLPASLARYIATSARCSSSPASTDPAAAVAMPTLERTHIGSPSTVTGSARRSRMRRGDLLAVVVVDVLQQHRELVAAHARRDVARPHAQLDPAGGGDQHGVARPVAGAVVDRLEVVEVEEQHGRHAAPARQRRLHAAQEQRAVGEPGERVALRLALEPVELERQAGVRGERLEQPQVLVGERRSSRRTGRRAPSRPRAASRRAPARSAPRRCRARSGSARARARSGRAARARRARTRRWRAARRPPSGRSRPSPPRARPGRATCAARRCPARRAAARSRPSARGSSRACGAAGRAAPARGRARARASGSRRTGTRGSGAWRARTRRRGRRAGGRPRAGSAARRRAGRGRRSWRPTARRSCS